MQDTTLLDSNEPLTMQALRDHLNADSAQIAIEGVSLGLKPVSSSEDLYHQILNAFINSLDNDIDRQIMYMRANGKNQAEIAAALGYANHTPVTKRLQRLKKQFETFKKINGKQMKENRRKQMLPSNLSCKACVLLLDSLPYFMVHWLGQKNKYGYFKRRKIGRLKNDISIPTSLPPCR